MKKLPFEVHPAANIFPMIKGKAFEELVDDIRENGLNEPIAFWKGKLLDGRNRSMACVEIGIDPLEHAIDLDPETDPVAFVLSANLYRRHLNETERESVATKVAGLSKGDNQHTKQDGPNGLSTKDAAEMLNVSENGIKRNKAARKSGCDELVESLDAGEIPSSTAAAFVKAVPDKKEQAKILEEGLPAVRQAIKEAKIERDPITKPQKANKATEPKAIQQDELYDLAVIRAFEHCDYRMNTLRMIFDSLQEYERQVVKSWFT